MILKFRNLLIFLVLCGCAAYAPQQSRYNNPTGNPNYNPQQSPYYNPTGNPNYNPQQSPYYNPTGNPNYNPSSINLGSRDDADYSRRRTEDSDRDETLSRARRGDSCEDERESHECYDLCKKMYKRVDDKEDCWKLTPDSIESIYDVWTALERGRLGDLEDIDTDDLDVFLNLSIAGFDALIRDYKKSEAEDVLVWIAENEEVAEVMRDEDDDFETLEELLSLVDRFELDSVEDPFTEYIDRKTLFEYAISTGNDTAIDYFFDYFLQTHKSCRTNNFTDDCLTVVCSIGSAIDERDREDILESNLFSDFMEDIIKKTINGSLSASGEKWIKGSGEGKIDSIKDLDDSWANAEWDLENNSKPICGGLVSE